MAKKEISEERKLLYYAGMAVSGIGLLLFLSVFVSFMNPKRMFANGSMGDFMSRPFIELWRTIIKKNPRIRIFF